MFWEDVPSAGPRDKRCTAWVPGFLAGEGVHPVADFPVPPGAQQFDHIETDAYFGYSRAFPDSCSSRLLFEQGDPLLRRQNDAALFFPVYRFGGETVVFAGAGFDFHKDQFACSTDSAHQVHLAPMEWTEVAVEDFVSGFVQKSRGPLFSFSAESCG